MKFLSWKPLALLGSTMTMFLCSGCVPSPTSGFGFTLPEGNEKRGEQVYRDLKCAACHSIKGVDSSSSEAEGQVPDINVALGGEVTRIKTYGELVTAIINPSHKLAPGYDEAQITVDGQSAMRNYNDVLTVSQLADLVSFLQSKYKIVEYRPTDYPVYPYTF